MINHGAMQVALVGSTASGKSALAHALALESNGDIEIIAVDAMTVYRGMDIGTSKPTKAEQKEVAYHCLDLVDPSEEFTVAQYQQEARGVAEMIRNLGSMALYVGGTGLYGRAVIDNMDLPGQFPVLRQELEERASTELPAMYAQLSELDPLGASRMEPTNARRIVRALEVTLGSGRPFSSYGDGLLTYGPVRVVQVGLSPNFEELDQKIESRFHQMMESGLLSEVETIANSPLGFSRTAAQAVGYKELLKHLRGEVTLDEAVQEAIVQSRRLARRQRSWFRRDPRIEWFENPDAAGERILEVLNSPDGFVRD